MEERINAFLSAHRCTAPLVKEYGMTEVCGIMCVSDRTAVHPGTAGRALAGSTIVAAAPETGAPLPPDQEGELLIHSPTVMNGYYGLPQADGEVLRPGPEGKLWVWTKDIGRVAADGTVTVTGRKKRMISRNGFKIFPNVIEDCLLQSPLVAACAVVGGERKGETLPVAHVVLAPGVEKAQAEPALKAHCKGALNDYLIPGGYRFRAALPLTERGKLDYRALELEGFPSEP
jgi:acyl-coenzyme A synthetase/AMP-(fatty) acid ligase